MVTVLRPLTSPQFQIHHRQMRSSSKRHCLFLALFFFTSLTVAKAKITIKVLQSEGTILDSSQTTKTSPWTRKSWVADRLALELKENAQTKIELNPQLILTVYGPAEFEIPTIGWETRHFKEIKLVKGSIRLEVKDRSPFEFDLSTPFFRIKPPSGIWVVNIDQDRALADILALKGNLEVAALNSEDKVSLKTGERVTFRGLLEEREISYDLLLEGRKIPKGKWTAVEKLASTEIKKFSLESERERLIQVQKRQAQTQATQQKRQAGDLCTQPKGSLGECLWQKVKADCIRTRCAADGKWKDPQIVGLSFCDKASGWSSTPKACDY